MIHGMEIIQQFFENSQYPLLTAFILGILVVMHPCPLAANIAAIGLILRRSTKKVDSGQLIVDSYKESREVSTGEKQNSQLSARPAGTLARARTLNYQLYIYVLGRTLAYSLLGILLVFLIRIGAKVLHVGDQLSIWGERLLAPLLIVIGLYLLYNDLLHHHDHVPSTKDHQQRFSGVWGSLWLGVLFALAFCPESGIVYFGMIIPMAVQSSVAYLIPVAFAIGAALPVLFLSYLFAYGIQKMERFERGMHLIQLWLTRFVAVLFIVAGIFCLFF